MRETKTDTRKIYKITNKINGKVYVGCASDFSKRKYAHKSHALKGDYKEGNILYPEMRAFGLSNFDFEVIETCHKSKAKERERFWINQYGSFGKGYNTSPHGLCGYGFWNGKRRPDVRAMRLKDNSIVNAIEVKKIPIVCVETGETFGSITEASNKYGITISAIARSIRESRGCRKLTFLKVRQ